MAFTHFIASQTNYQTNNLALPNLTPYAVVWTSCQTPDGKQAVTRQTVHDVQFFILESWGWVRACPHAEKQFRLSRWQQGCKLPNVAEIKP